MAKLEYMVPSILNLEGYYIVFHLQICIKMGITPPMIGAWVFEHDIFTMWPIDDIKFKKDLMYSLIYGYFIFDNQTYMES
jgi:hypothetical protein